MGHNLAKIFGIPIEPLRKEGHVLFNDALNTFYVRSCGVGQNSMVKDHSDSERGLFYMHHPTDRITHTTVFCYTSCGSLAGTRNSSMGPP